MDRHATYVHTFSAPAPLRSLPPPALAEGPDEKTALHLRARCRIARPMTWDDIVADRAARGLSTLDSPAPLQAAPQLRAAPSRGPSPSRGPKREVWQRGTWQPNAFAEWERERRVGRAVKSLADLLSRPEWKGASIVGEVPNPMVASEAARALRFEQEAARCEREAEALRERTRAARAEVNALSGAGRYLERGAKATEAGHLELRLNGWARDAASALRSAKDARERSEAAKASAPWVCLRHPSGATVTIDPSKVA
jgi:hypothetical protein